jgi:bacterioferritin-associated ferredoxin
MTHVELHICKTAREAEYLAHAGLPRYDLEPSKCGSCQNTVGEVFNRDGESVAWRPLTVVVWDNGLDVLCGKCTKAVDTVLAKL